jgi:hypothetical protein
MLALLLDEHISPVVAEQLNRKHSRIRVIALRDWQAGRFLGAPDSLILSEAAREGQTLVSYDQRTIRPLLKSWIEQSVDNGGVVFVDEKAIAPQDVGALVKAIGRLWKSERKANWRNRVVFLRRAAV